MHADERNHRYVSALIRGFSDPADCVAHDYRAGAAFRVCVKNRDRPPCPRQYLVHS